MASPEWSRIVDIGTLSDSEKSFSLQTSEAERTAIAERLGVLKVISLRGNVHLSRVNDGVDLRADLDAVLERTCSASLAPMQEVINETIETLFSHTVVDKREADDIVLSDDAIEPLEGDTIDIAEFLVQQLALVMDPWPRKSDARSLAEDFGKSGESSPFSVLKGAFEDSRDEN